MPDTILLGASASGGYRLVVISRCTSWQGRFKKAPNERERFPEATVLMRQAVEAMKFPVETAGVARPDITLDTTAWTTRAIFWREYFATFPV